MRIPSPVEKRRYITQMTSCNRLRTSAGDTKLARVPGMAPRGMARKLATQDLKLTLYVLSLFTSVLRPHQTEPLYMGKYGGKSTTTWPYGHSRIT